jgi:hypothetical protein
MRKRPVSHHKRHQSVAATAVGERWRRAAGGVAGPKYRGRMPYQPAAILCMARQKHELLLPPAGAGIGGQSSIVAGRARVSPRLCWRT